MTAPVVSDTVPVILARLACPAAMDAQRRKNKKNLDIPANRETSSFIPKSSASLQK
jgi:hypothetical protein